MVMVKFACRKIIEIPAITIGAISKNIISYQTGGFMKGTQELNLNKEINKFSM